MNIGETVLAVTCAAVLVTATANYAFPRLFAVPPPSADLASRMCENHVAPDEARYAGAWDEPCKKIMGARFAQKMVGWQLEAATAQAENIYELAFVKKVAQEQK